MISYPQGGSSQDRREAEDYTPSARLMLQAVRDTGGFWGLQMPVDFVRGSRNAKIMKHFGSRLARLPSYGEGAAKPAEWWGTTFKDSINDAILHAIFADGAAACVLAAKKPSEVPVGTLAIVDEHGHLMDGTKDGITLAINDDGISCTLSKYLPQYIAKNMGGFVDAFLGKHGIKRADCLGPDFFWAIHPGGRRIIEEAQNGLGLKEAHAADSWAVLDTYGNMLSPSVMFVLDRVFQRQNNWIKNGEYDLIVNTTASQHSRQDSETIRRQALTHKVTYFTTLAAARAACEAHRAGHDHSVNRLQTLHETVRQ